MVTSLTQDEVRAFALSLPETHESSHHGTPDLRVRNKIFATLPAEGNAVNVKIVPDDLAMLVRSDPEAFRDLWGGRWLGVDLGRVDAGLIRELVVDAWCLTAPKSLVRAYRSSSDLSP